MIIREKLNEAIDKKNISMLSIAKQTGIAYQTIRQISLDINSNPTQKTVRKLTAYLDALEK